MILTTHTANEAEVGLTSLQELSDRVGIMLNSEIIRINTLDKITMDGHIVKLTALTRSSEEEWKKITDKFLETLKGKIEGMGESEEVKILQGNSTDKCNIQVPNNKTFTSIHSLMQLCYTFCEDIKNTSQIDLNYVVLRTNLEQTFLAYAAHQRVNEKTA